MPGTMYTKAWRAGGCESADKRKETNQDNENKGWFSDLPPDMMKPAANQAFGGNTRKKQK